MAHLPAIGHLPGLNAASPLVAVFQSVGPRATCFQEGPRPTGPPPGRPVDGGIDVKASPAASPGQLRPRKLQPGVHGLALEGEHPEDALVNLVKWLAADEALKRLDAEGKLS